MECGLCKALGQESKLLPLYQAQAMPTSEEMQEYRQQVEALDKLKVHYILCRVCNTY